MTEPRRRLVTIHFPITGNVASQVMRVVARGYPGAVIAEDGTIWDRRLDQANPAELAAEVAPSNVGGDS